MLVWDIEGNWFLEPGRIGVVLTLDQTALAGTAVANTELDIVALGVLATAVDRSRVNSNSRSSEHQALEESEGTHGDVMEARVG